MQVEQALMLEWYVSQVLDIPSLSTPNWSPGCRDLRFLAKSKSCWHIQNLACHRHSNRSPLSYKNQRCDGGKADKSKSQTPERDMVILGLGEYPTFLFRGKTWGSMSLPNLFATAFRFCCLSSASWLETVPWLCDLVMRGLMI